MITPRVLFLLSYILLGLVSSAVQAVSNYPVAGLTPDVRPDGAPRLINEHPIDATHALHGVPAPRPAGLEFVEGQGGWYTPFTRPGMPGPYDLRSWHVLPPKKGGAK